MNVQSCWYLGHENTSTEMFSRMSRHLFDNEDLECLCKATSLLLAWGQVVAKPQTSFPVLSMFLAAPEGNPEPFYWN